MSDPLDGLEKLCEEAKEFSVPSDWKDHDPITVTLSTGALRAARTALPKALAERGELARLVEEAVKVLEGFAKIEIPFDAADGNWVAKALYCNDMVTAFQVRAARLLHSKLIALRDVKGST